MSIHDDFIKKALEAIQELFCDTSVPQSTTRESMNNLRHEISDLLDSIEG